MRYLLAVLLLTFLAGCTKPDESIRTLRSAGYRDITITGFSFFGCSEDDVFRTGFTATGASGEKVEGVVCSALFKGNTIRIN